MGKAQPRRLPLMHDAAEYLAMGYLLRRNILAYKAPPRNEGYDLICIHPDSRRRTKVVRIQDTSRYQTDSDRSALVREESFLAFDFLIIVPLNIGWLYDSQVARPESVRHAVE